MLNVLLGIAIVAAVHLAGACVNMRISSRSDAREMWEWLAVAWFWWALGPHRLIQEIRRRRRYRRWKAGLTKTTAEERIP